MWKFRELAAQITRGPDPLATEKQFFVPPPLQEKLVTLAHSVEYYRAFINGQLDAAAMRRIGKRKVIEEQTKLHRSISTSKLRIMPSICLDQIAWSGRRTTPETGMSK